MSSKNLSRRALVAATAAAIPAAIAGPALADIGDDGDAELLRLGAQLDEAVAEFHTMSASDATRRFAWEVACEAAGLPWRRDNSFASIAEWREYSEAREAIHEDPDPDPDRWDRFNDRRLPLVDAILAIKPKTVAGLGVLARAFTLWKSQEWEHPEVQCSQDVAFMEAVCAFAGVLPVPIENEVARSTLALWHRAWGDESEEA
jgi:hypothetical protein